jgi:serine/threonine-protein kinase
LLNKRYRLLAALAAGGMATVFKAQDTMLSRLVAIKVLRDRYASDPQFVQRFRDEAQAAANLNHPNIVTIYDVGHDVIQGQERYYFVMELVEGQDLKQAIRARAINGQPFSIDESVEIARQVCEGVAYAHRRGLAHCDLKPQNVMLTNDGRVKVTDFGIARAYTSVLNTGERTNVVWGTPQYYAPEQASGGAPTPASDVYSIGVMLYEMLVGRLPFEARDAATLGQMHLTQTPPLLHTLNPNVTLQLEGIVNRALAKDPAQRYVNADQLVRTLAAYALQGEEQTMMGMQPVQSPAQSPSPQPAQPIQGTTATAPRAIASKPKAQPAQPKSVAPQPQPQPKPVPIQPKRNVITDTVPTAAVQAGRDGLDPMIWLLAAIAFLCVLGLIPLYLAVYQAYAAPAPVAAPTAPSAPAISATINVTTPMPGTPQPVAVPVLAGKPFTDATRALADLGLNISVVEERPGGNYTETVVLEQRTPAQTLVPPGAVVEVVINKVTSEGELRDVPADLIGRTFDDALSQTLKTIGWNVALTEALNFAPQGTILALQPPGGSKLAVSETLTVTLSNGGVIDLSVDMSPVVLESVTLARDTFVPGQTVQFRVRWGATGPVGRDYNVGWYLFTPDGGTPLVQGEDRVPQDNGVPTPTSLWQADTIVDDTYSLRIPDNLPPGTYPLQIVMYSGAERLPVRNPGNTTAVSDRVVLHTIRVQ